MLAELKFVDSFAIKCNATSKFACEVSEDGFVSLLTEKCIFICRQIPTKENMLPIITYSQYLIEPTDYILATNLCIDVESILYELDQWEVYESVLRSDIYAGIITESVKTSRYLEAKWSPAGIFGQECLIAVLNDIGSIDIYGKVVDCTGLVFYLHLVNMTQVGINQYKHEWISVNGSNAREVYGEFKRRLEIHTPVAFEFSHNLTENNTNHVILFVAYANGRIAMWRLNVSGYGKDPRLHYEFICDYDTKLLNISKLHWRKSKNAGLLFIGDKKGGVKILPIKELMAKSMNIFDEISLTEQDDVNVDKIHTFINKDNLFLCIVKQSVIDIYMLDNTGRVMDQCCFVVGNVYITGLQQISESTISVLTMTGVLKEIQLQNVNNKIDISWKHVYVNINWSVKRSYGFFVSKNNAILTILTGPCRYYDMKEEKRNCHINNFLNKGIEPLDLVINNNTTHLTNLGDCLEAIRINTLHSKRYLSDHFVECINYDEVSLLQLKIYLYFSKILEPVHETAENYIQHYILPPNELETMISIKLSVYYINHILSTKQLSDLSNFERECLKMLTSYLKEIVLSDVLERNDLKNNYVNEVFDALLKTEEMDFSFPTICFICNNDLFGSFCIINHNSNRCSVTMTQINIVRYKCQICKRFVHEEVVKELGQLLCPFCDFPLDSVVGQNKSTKNYPINSCTEDCLRE